MFERFTDRARQVIVLAQAEARLLNHNYIGTEHILLGLISEGEGVAALALDGLGVSLEEMRARVEEMIGRGQASPTGHIPFTPRAKKIMELSFREALQLGHNYIGTEHILLGLIREGDGIAAQVLQQVGVELAATRHKVLELLGEPEPKARPRSRRRATRVEPAPADEPLCPTCRRPIEETARYRLITISAKEEGGAPIGIRALFCTSCGRTLATEFLSSEAEDR